MSGIAGYVGKNIDKKILKKMTDRLVHRGPDGCGNYLDDNCALGYCHLALSSDNECEYPIASEDGNLILVCDGEVNNYDELKKELKELGHKFKTKEVNEVILHGYEEWGKEILSKIRGTFALAIWNKKEQELFCARDGWGSKPIYYYKNDSTFMFASEIKAFLDHPEFDKQFNNRILSAYLCFNSVPTKESFFLGVYRIEPGHFMTYKKGKINDEVFFRLEFKESKEDFKSLVNQIDEAVRDSVKVNSNKNEKLGSFLSSGIDSSYLVSILKPKETFTIGYENKKYNEVEYAKDLSNKLGINNNSRIVTKEDYLKDFSKIMYYCDEPLANPSLPAIYLLTEEASKKVKVVFSGEGADELYGGYNSYQEEITQSWYMKIPYPLRRMASAIASIVPEARGLNFIYRRGLKLKDYNIGLGRIFRDKEAMAIVKDKNQVHTKDVVAPYYEVYKDDSTLVQRQVIDYYYWLVNDFSFAVDRTCAMFSMGGRTPYLDNRVYEVAMKLPTSAKINKTTTKIALREAAKMAIPNESYKKKKLGFPVPLREWIRDDDLYNMIKTEFRSEIAEKYFNQKKILKMLDNHKKGKKDEYKKIWAIYTFLVWYKEFFVKM